MIEWLVMLFAGIGAFFLAVASFGIWRLPDLYCRMHAQTKAGTLGLAGVLLAAAIFFGEAPVWIKAVLTLAFQFLTTPAGAHMLARSAHRKKIPLWSGSLRDDLERTGS